MSFGLSPSMPFSDLVGTVDASWLNFVRASLADAVDGVGGGSYNLLSGHTLDFPAGGGNITIEAPLAFTNATVPSGGALTLAPGGELYAVAGSLINIYGTVDLENGALLEVLLGGQILVDSGANFNMRGVMNVDAFGVVNVGVNGLGPGAIIVDGTGTATGSAIEFANGGELSLASSSAAQWATGATLTMLSTAGLAHFQNVAQLDQLTATQTGIYSRSGTAAKNTFRFGTITSGTIADPGSQDFWRADGSGNVLLAVPGGAIGGQIVTVYMALGHSTTIVVGDATNAGAQVTIGRFFTAGGTQTAANGPASASFVLVGGHWECFAKTLITYTDGIPNVGGISVLND